MTRQRPPDKLITLTDVVCKATTQKALLIVDCDGSENWIPRSHIKKANDEDGCQTTIYEKGDEGDLVITEWIAKQKGIA
jgi:hypothetical protein